MTGQIPRWARKACGDSDEGFDWGIRIVDLQGDPSQVPIAPVWATSDFGDGIYVF